MIYRIVTYGRPDERMRGSLVIPNNAVSWAKQVAGVQPEDDGLGEYLLSEDQTRALAQYLGFKPEPEQFYYYLEPYEAAEDTGFQSADVA
ncbi:MAG TPA: hypothetical protein VME45_11615 [Stellaceae bacterium]|nr:hypothetical protein [Stellaceae bacterium]